MISKIKRFLFGCNGCEKSNKMLESAQSEINSFKDSMVLRGNIYEKEIQALKVLRDENVAMRKEIVSLQTVRDNLIGERKDFNEQQKIALERWEREKDSHKLTQLNKDRSDKAYRDLAIQNKRMLDIVNDDQIKARLNVLKKMGKLKDIEEYYAKEDKSIQPLSDLIMKLDKDDNWVRYDSTGIDDGVYRPKPDVLEGVTPSPEKDEEFKKKLIKEYCDSRLEGASVPNIKLDNGWQKTSPELSAILDKKYGTYVEQLQRKVDDSIELISATLSLGEAMDKYELRVVPKKETDALEGVTKEQLAQYDIDAKEAAKEMLFQEAVKKAKKESKKHVRIGKKDTTRQVQT